MFGFDYSSDRLYFVTICVKDRICCLGSVEKDSSEDSVGTGHDLSVLNSEDNYSEKNHFFQLSVYGLIVEDRIKWLHNQYDYVEIHNYVVMPNHIHLIIEIDRQKVKGRDIKIKSLSSLIGALKTTSSKLIHESGLLSFAWQRSFHDHIIRNNIAYQNISNYIDLNPHRWLEDTFFEKH